jgi:cytochrome c oxidase subunit III
MSQQENFSFHPRNVMLFLMLFGLSAMFLALTFSYTYTRITMNTAAVQVPMVFVFSTIMLLTASYFLIKSKQAYKTDDTQGYLKYIKQAMLLSLGFMLCQTIGWLWLLNVNQITMQSSNSSAYLYLISILHLLHVLVGIPFMYRFYQSAKKAMIDPVTVMVYFSDPAKQLSLRLLTIYWHFVDLLWIYLVLFFLVNMAF